MSDFSERIPFNPQRDALTVEIFSIGHTVNWIIYPDGSSRGFIFSPDSFIVGEIYLPPWTGELH